jgi:hypothetical protein
LGSTENLGKGTVEIDEELLWIDSFDRIANTATVSPYGRGYLGTTAATHTVDTKVTLRYARNLTKACLCVAFLSEQFTKIHNINPFYFYL